MLRFRGNIVLVQMLFGVFLGLVSLLARSDDMPGDGEFVLLESLEGVVHKIQMHLSHSEQSLETGWVKMHQCHHDMAPTGRSSVDFRPERVRGLQLLLSKGVGKAWVGERGISVEMEDVSRGNEVCFQGEVRSVYLSGDQYRQNSGPYYLRFLDGYFPLKLDLTIDSSRSGTKISVLEPLSIPYQVDASSLHLDLLFEGRLMLVFSLEEREVMQ